MIYNMIAKNDFTKLGPYLWELPKSYRPDMNVPARIYATEEMLDSILQERAAEQLVNVATLPGIMQYALAMPDIHEGYGFPVGGVAAIRTSDGVISPGGIGYDINCGVRLLMSQYKIEEIKDKLEALATQIQRDVPSGVGRGGRLVLTDQQMDEVLKDGVRWGVKQGYALEEDLDAIEENGRFEGANPDLVPARAKKRGLDQLGTMGAGNHFLEIQRVIEIFDKEIADSWGLSLGQVTVMIHTGSRGLGHEVCTDFVRLMNQVMPKYKIQLPDRELACAPFQSKEGQQYFGAMKAAANFAWMNRQMITHQVRGAWTRILGDNPRNDLKILYDVAHNIAKVETYNKHECAIHRKGATRAFAPGRTELAERFQKTGQPVLIPGSMGTFSYVLAGTYETMKQSFGTCCHGAGRQMSRSKAKKTLDYNKLRAQLKEYEVIVRAGSSAGLIEEAPEAYKAIEDVIEVVHGSSIAKRVAKLRPVAVIKG